MFSTWPCSDVHDSNKIIVLHVVSLHCQFCIGIFCFYIDQLADERLQYGQSNNHLRLPDIERSCFL
jgi:hypothetical protein